MAGSDSSTSGASQLPKLEAPAITIKVSKKVPRRKLTLIAISVCLHVLLWSSVFTLVISLYLIVADPGDTTSLPTIILTIASSLVSAAYIVIHTVFSFKQRIWRHQRRHPSIIKKTSYIAVRFTVTLIVLWLLTSGWNLITVARRPVCLPARPGLAGWEAGTPCIVGRVGVAISLIALIASCTIFGMLAVVRRPFEAHLFKIGYQRPINPKPTPSVSRAASPTRSASLTSEKYRIRTSASTRRSTFSNHSNTDIDTLNLDLHSSSNILAPSPIRSIGLGIFTSQFQPPPLPPAYIPPRSTSLDLAIFHPSSSHTSLQPPPQLTSLIPPSGFVHFAHPGQYSASTWRAVHPTLPSPLGPHASRSQPHLPFAAHGYNFSYRSRYARSSVSLTRPHRLSTATPAGSVGWSSRSGSTGPEEGRGSEDEGGGEGMRGDKRASASQIAYAILNDVAFPGSGDWDGKGKGKGKARHVRHASAPDSSIGAGLGTGRGSHIEGQEDFSGRQPKGWKPRVSLSGKGKDTISGLFDTDTHQLDLSSHPNLRLRFSGIEGSQFQTQHPHSVSAQAPIRKSRSESPLRHSQILDAARKSSPDSESASSRSSRISRLPRDPMILKRNSRSFTLADTLDTVAGGEVQKGKGREVSTEKDRRVSMVKPYEEVKNKPLPRIAAL